MFSNEGFFRLVSVAILGVLFISVTAMADKEKKNTPPTLFSFVKNIEEAEQINNDELRAVNLTSIGDRIEVVAPQETKK